MLTTVFVVGESYLLFLRYDVFVYQHNSKPSVNVHIETVLSQKLHILSIKDRPWNFGEAQVLLG